MSRGTVVNVCFKTKKVTSVGTSNKPVKSYTWSCFNCNEKHTYTQGAKGNMKSIAISFDNEEFRLCPKCIKTMNDKMEEN